MFLILKRRAMQIKLKRDATLLKQEFIGVSFPYVHAFLFIYQCVIYYV